MTAQLSLFDAPGPGRVCSVDGCERPHKTRGLCQMHYWRWRVRGATGPADRLKLLRQPDACMVDGCANSAHGRGLCQMHYSRWRRHGDPGPAEKQRPRSAAIGTRRLEPGRGYVQVKVPAGHWAARRNNWAYEHRVAMGDVLGRPLKPHENVHHRNGIRHDNRPENLELWTRPQPAGQRVADLAAWAAERYGNAS